MGGDWNKTRVKDLQNLILMNISKIVTKQEDYQQNGQMIEFNLLSNGLKSAGEDICDLNCYDVEAMQKTIEIVGLK